MHRILGRINRLISPRVDFHSTLVELRAVCASRMILESGRVIYLELSPFAVNPMFWFSVWTNQITGKVISSSGCGPDCLRGISTLSTLRQNSECAVANDRTTADCSQLFRFCAWPERKINFRYAVVVPPVLVLKVSNINVGGGKSNMQMSSNSV